MRKALSVGCAGIILLALTGSSCDEPIQPSTTSVGLSVATLVKTVGLVDTGGNNCTPAVPPAPDVQKWWDGLPPDNRMHPYVGFEAWRNTTGSCRTSRLDVYRALVTFNTASVSRLKGLVTRAELVVSPFALPPGAVGAPTATCAALTGGAATLQRFGPGVSLPPVSGTGQLNRLQPSEAFPAGDNVFTFPRPWTVGAVPGAADATTTVANGQGGAVFTVDVTSQVNAALNGSFPGMSWMVTSGSEGPLTTPVTAGLDCKTPYSFRLNLTHL